MRAKSSPEVEIEIVVTKNLGDALERARDFKRFRMKYDHSQRLGWCKDGRGFLWTYCPAFLLPFFSLQAENHDMGEIGIRFLYLDSKLLRRFGFAREKDDAKRQIPRTNDLVFQGFRFEIIDNIATGII